MYLITVTKTNADGSEDVWDVYRRYSDFHDLHLTILERVRSRSFKLLIILSFYLNFFELSRLRKIPLKVTLFIFQYDSLSGLALPSKKTFNNMNKEFLEKRRVGLNAYLQV